MPSGTIHVVATLNVTQRTGELRHVTPVAAIPPGQAALASGRPRRRASAAPRPARRPTILLRVFGKGDALIARVRRAVHPGRLPRRRRRRLGIDRRVRAGRIGRHAPRAGAGRRRRRHVRARGGRAAGRVQHPRQRAGPRQASRRPRRAAARTGGPASDDDDADPVLSWTPAVPAGRGTRAALAPRRRRTPAAGGPAAGADTRYTVQVSVDGGATWQTVGYGLTEPQVRIDRTVLGDAETVKVRVTATTGFRSVSTEKTMKASELG